MIRFSIIVPTFNEEQDIQFTLTALEKVQYPDVEVIVVDDGSRDKTVQIVETTVQRSPRFRLLIQPENRGVAAARNRGIKEARGEVFVILNADVLLPEDFLNKIAVHYESGAQWVSVLSHVTNLERMYSRYTEAEAYDEYIVRNKAWVWTEGFSCTKKVALEVGMFPEAMPGCSGEDVDFGLNLEKRFNGVKTTEIVVPHIAPDRLNTYWGQQRGRGSGRTNYYYFMKKMGLQKLFLNSLLATVWRIAKICLGVPIFNAFRLIRHSPRKGLDFFPFVWVGCVKDVAMIAGIWKAYSRIFRQVFF